ncbi:MAG: FAD-dependent oxidoreductase [Opitutaceae bacterium]|nr:FAD-dependent oxidoreductase [Opitutaceae bacterium]
MCDFRRYSAVLLVALLLATSPAQAKTFDVVIYGGTPAGIAAGITAARGGASVVVIEPTRWIGGMVTGGLTRTDVGNEKVIGGFAREFFARAAASKPGTPMWFAEPHVNLATFRAMLAEAKVHVVTGQRLATVVRDRNRIVRCTTEDGTEYTGSVFIDATYEGDLMPRAGVSCVVGREGRDTYGESLAGFLPMPVRPQTPEIMGSECSCLGGKGPHYVHGTPAKISARDDAGRLISGVNEARAPAGGADGLTQAYNFRLVVTRNPANRVPFPKPARYDPTRYELLLRLIREFPGVRFGRLFHLGDVANGKFDLNAQGLFSTDYPGGNVSYPDGDYATRDQIWRDHVDYIQGMLWFVGHDERVPARLRDETNAWGLCRDEFVDNGHWPYALYVREARRMVGAAVLTQQDLQKATPKPDSIGMGSFVIDCHIVQRVVTADGSVTDEGSFEDARVRPYQIPYRCITPRRAECANLLVPVCASASHIAYCSLRMEPQYMALGHASGVAALLALAGHVPVQEVDVAALQAKLREQKAVLEFAVPGTSVTTLAGIVIDDEAAEYRGSWVASGYGTPIELGSRHDGNSGKGEKAARFTVALPQTGRYEVRFAYTAAPNRASAVPVTIEHADGIASVRVNEKLAPPLGQHFVSVGIFRFTAEKPAVVGVDNAGTDGFVSVDAVQFLGPLPNPSLP